MGTMPSVDIELLVPEGSGLEAALTAGDVDCEGRLGDVRIDDRYGDIRIDRAATLHARTSAGDITVGTVDGDADGRHLLRQDPGRRGRRRPAPGQRLRRHHRRARAGLGRGDHQVRPGERPQAGGGSLDLATSYGTVEAGVREGTPAWLDLAVLVRQGPQPADALGRPGRLRGAAPDPGPHLLRRHRRPSRLTATPPTESRAMSRSLPAAISTTGLRKSFGDHVVLDGLDLSVPEGTVFALLGPNGAGKTTTVDILVHAAAAPTAARCGWPATTWRASRTRSAPRSPSPASSPPSTTCSPARRTCG